MAHPRRSDEKWFRSCGPLTALALEVIAEAIDWAGRSNFVFLLRRAEAWRAFPRTPSRARSGAPTSPPRPARSAASEFRIGQRMTFGGRLDYMARLAIPRHIRAWIANHVTDEGRRYR